MKISDTIKYIGADDKTLDLFESQYKIPNGVSYNSYLILDEKVAVMDTVDHRAQKEWLEHLERELMGRTVDYLIVSHMEPDHAGNIKELADRYPEMKVVGNAKTFAMIPQFFEIELEGRNLVVKEGETLSLGTHVLQFFMAPMVHWPEVMVAYEQTEKILFSADGFGKFGTLDTEEAWTEEARRYYFNIVGKYGVQVQSLLKKVSGLEIHKICPLHGPVLEEHVEEYIGKYQIWSSYLPEESGVLVAHASIHGNTARAAMELAELIRQKGVKTVVVRDLARDDMSQVLAEAFRYDRMVLAAASYDGGVFPCMEEFLHHLKSKNYQKRTVGLMENGTWAPVAAKTMKNCLSEMKEITVPEPVVTIKSVLNSVSQAAMEELAKEISLAGQGDKNQ